MNCQKFIELLGYSYAVKDPTDIVDKKNAKLDRIHKVCQGRRRLRIISVNLVVANNENRYLAKVDVVINTRYKAIL